MSEELFFPSYSTDQFTGCDAHMQVRKKLSEILWKGSGKKKKKNCSLAETGSMWLKQVKPNWKLNQPCTT